jgi:hypothetical protein
VKKAKILLTLAIAASALAVVTSSAYAEFHAEKYPVKIHAQNTNEHTFTTANGAKLKCETVHFYGEQQLTANTEQIKVTPEYLKCKSESPLSGPVTVTDNECQYNFHQEERVNSEGKAKGSVTIECPSGHEIKVEVKTLGTCTFTVPGQGPLGGITYTNMVNKAGIMTVLVSAEVKGKVGPTTSGCAGAINGNEVFTYKGAAETEAQEENSPFAQVGILVT